MLATSGWKSCNRLPGYCMILLFAFLLMTGCAMVGPDFQTPETQVAQAWSQAEQDAVTQGSVDHETWWQNFNDPALNNLINKAYSQNLGLQVAGLRVYEARALLGFAVGTLYPQSQSLRGSASTIKISENADPVSALPPGFFDRDFDRYGTSFDAAWELDFWGRFRRGIESADANFAASIATYDDVMVTLSGEVATAYVLLRSLEERLSYAESNVAIQQRSFEIADVRFRNGLVTELDSQLARALLGNTRSLIPELNKGIRQSYSTPLIKRISPKT